MHDPFSRLDEIVAELRTSKAELEARAEARGFRRAIEALRDTDALLTWWQRRFPEYWLDTEFPPHMADYLESLTEALDG